MDRDRHFAEVEASCHVSLRFKSLVIYPLVNKLVDPENHPCLMETHLPTPMTGRVYVNLLGYKWDFNHENMGI